MMYVLKQHRLDKGYSCETMARKLGICKTYYWQIEQGKKRIAYDLAMKMAKIFEVTPDTLLYDDIAEQMTKKSSS